MEKKKKPSGIQKAWRQLSIQNQIFLSMFLITLLGVGVLMNIVYKTSIDAIEQNYRASYQSTLKNSSRVMDMNLKNIVDVGRSFLNDEALQQILKKGNEYGGSKFTSTDRVKLRVIANEMAVALQKNGKNIYADGTRTHEKAAAFAEKYGIGKVYDDFHEMFTDPEVDVIYITTPHNTHLGFMKEAIANGKHILVEKSITLNSDELDEAIALAKEKGVIIGEAMTIYHMPIYKELKKILDSGRLGRVNLITMNFGSFKEYNMKNRFFNRNLAGGAMLDIGVYALSFIRWFFDSKPDQLLSQVKPAPTGVDEQAGLLLTNQEGQMASVMLSLHSKQPKRGMVSCENGFIEIMEYPRAWEAKITDASTGESEIIKAGDNADALAYELADMERAINGDSSAMHLDYTKDVMDLMTSFRRTWGYTYPEEEK